MLQLTQKLSGQIKSDSTNSLKSLKTTIFQAYSSPSLPDSIGDDGMNCVARLLSAFRFATNKEGRRMATFHKARKLRKGRSRLLSAAARLRCVARPEFSWVPRHGAGRQRLAAAWVHPAI